MGSDPGNGWGLARGDKTGNARPRSKPVRSRPVGGGKPPKKGCALTALAMLGTLGGALWEIVALVDKALS